MVLSSSPDLRPPIPDGGDHPEPVRERGRRLLQLAAVVLGAALAAVGALDGSPAWRVARVTTVLAVAATIVWLVGRRNRWLAGTSAFVAGLPGLSVGAGIGLWYLGHGRAGPLALAGLAALVAGLVLSGGGAALLWRAAPAWGRPAVVLLGLAALVLLVAPGTLAVAATNVPRPALGSATPADRGLTYVDATFAARDGVPLSGWYLPSHNGAAVALLHGASSTRSAVLDQAAVLARHGYGVLLFDARGHGRSGGRAMELGWYGDPDTSGAVSFLSRRPDVEPGRIAVLGLSMGGEEAVGAAAADRRIRAVVAEGATGRTRADRGWLPTHWRGQVQRVIDRVTFSLTDALTDAHPPVSLRDAVRLAAPRPVLLIAAGESPAGSEAAADRWIRSAAPDSVTVWVVPGATHTGGLHARPRQWEARVIGFLDAAL